MSLSTADAYAMRQDILRAWTLRLYREYDDILYQYNLCLSKPLIRIEPLARDWGQWCSETGVITLACRLIENHSWDVVLEVLKHEMAHQLADERFGGQEAGQTAHGPAFQHACRRLGLAGWAASAAGSLPQEIPDWRRRVLTVEEEKLLKRAEKLLALAESSNEHEAALAVERVRQLYAKYNLDRLSSGAEPGHVYCVINRRRRRIEIEDSAIFSILNGHFMVRVIFTSLYDARDCREYRVAELLGTRENVLMGEYVYYFLRHKLDVLWEQYRARNRAAGKARRSYMLGVLDGFRNKLAAPSGSADSRPASDGSSRALLALAEGRLEAFVASRYPKLSTRGWTSGYHDGRSYGAGIADGSAITLQRGIARHAGNRGLQLPEC